MCESLIDEFSPGSFLVFDHFRLRQYGKIRALNVFDTTLSIISLR